MLLRMRVQFLVMIVLGVALACGAGAAAYYFARPGAPQLVTVEAPRRSLPVIEFRSVELPPLPPVPETVQAPLLPLAERGVVISDEPFGPPRSEPVAVPKAPRGRGRIAIIIDDMGMDIVHSKAIIALPGPLTLSFLPYAPRVRDLAAAGRTKGDELMIHMPMQPINPALDLGSIALRAGMSDEAFDAMLNRAFDAFPGYVGLNNHMGSLLTQDRHAMARLMTALKSRGMIFVDSRTTAQSVAADEAAKAGVLYASRDVFLDDDESEAAVMEALRKTERVAAKNGFAVAIGHPHPGTIAALRAWIPEAKARGFVLVTVSGAVGASPLPNGERVRMRGPAPSDFVQ